jgi:peptidoglycan L-alanyl-D-glutamate endopeptidase CwlK
VSGHYSQPQNALYAQGRTTPGKIVTNAKGGQSFHNYGVAFDFVPIVGGKAQWNDVALFTKCGEIAESIGLEWAGRWVKFKELAHCQYTGGLTLQDFQQGKTL